MAFLSWRCNPGASCGHMAGGQRRQVAMFTFSKRVIECPRRLRASNKTHPFRMHWSMPVPFGWFFYKKWEYEYGKDWALQVGLSGFFSVNSGVRLLVRRDIFLSK